MEVRRYEPALRERWNALNARARNGHFLFDRNFMEYHADRFDDASLVVFDGGEPVALLPANRRDETIHSHQGLTFAGLVVDALRTADVLACLEACAAHWREAGAARLIYKPIPWIYHRRPAQEDLYWLFRRDARLRARLVSAAVRLDWPGAVSQRRRRGAAKAARSGLVFARSFRFDDFWQILSSVLGDRHRAVPVHTANEMRLLAERFPDNIELYTAERDSEILAGVVIFRTDQVAHTQYLAASPEGRASGALDGLLSALMDRSREGAAWFDFGTSNEADGRVLNEGLVRQKEEFGASAVAHDIYELPL